MQTLPGGVHLEQRGDGLRIEVAAPRAVLGALALMLFGALAIGLVSLSGLAVMPSHGGDGAGMLATVLFAAVALPVAAFGLLFLVIGVATLGTSRNLAANADGLRVHRSCFGVPTGAWNLPRDQLTAVNVAPAPKFQNVGAPTLRMQVVAVRRGGRAITLADALDEDGAARLRQALAEALEFADPSAPGAPHDAD
jgi:hypothetical protein